MELHPDMTFTWRDTPDRNQSYLIKRRTDTQTIDRRVEQTIEEMMMQPAKGQ